VDLRVDDNSDPLKEMKRLLQVHRAYESMDAGDAAMEKGDMAGALGSYSKAEALFPENEEMMFWHAVGLANNGRFEESMPLFKKVFAKNDNWRVLLPRLVPSGLLKLDQGKVRRLTKK
jgi:tetratricopeptide (TPR) repeat protein